ncbi:hypothetical protein GOB17_08935, partial [Sinorhizobium meliloti]|nr:hypothetical protein [Sinorhizobium meliloti]
RPKKRCQPANNLSKPPKNRRLWTGTRLIELCQRGVRNKDSLREMLRAAA